VLIKFNRIHIQRPSEFLVCNVGMIPPGKVLDLAMGRGRNAVFLAKSGFDVEGVDISEEAVIYARNFARQKKVTIKAEVADLESGYKITPDYYDGIICFNYLQRSLIEDIKKGLKNGGVIIYETYIIDQAVFGRPDNPAHLLQHNELLRMFQDLRCLKYREGVFKDGSRQKAIASIAAKKTILGAGFPGAVTG
jgi:tellurite methyltransferase